MMDEIPTLGDWLELAPWRTPAVTIVRIGDGLSNRSAHTVAGKRDLVNDFNANTLFAIWTGKYRSDIRAMTDSELDRVRELLA